MDHLLGGGAVAPLARREELAVIADRAAEPARAREHEVVVALGPPVEALDLGHEARAAGGAVTDRVEVPARLEVRVDLAQHREPGELTHQRAHARNAVIVKPLDADARGQPLEAEAGGIDLLEILAGEPADERASRVADLDETLALELGEPDADRRLRDAESLGEVALHERRPLRELSAEDERRVTRRQREPRPNRG